MRVIEAFVKYIPREEIPDDAKWLIQDSDGEVKSSSSHTKPEMEAGVWQRGLTKTRGKSWYLSKSEDAETTVVTREELMRAYDLTEQGYTLWFGGECPVPAGTIIDVEYRSLSGVSNIPAGVIFRGAGKYYWVKGWLGGNDASSDDIIAYRLSSVPDGNEENQGTKDDSQKPRFSLVPAEALSDVIDVLEFGSQKYGEENWRKVDNAQERYFNAAMRHLMAWRKGELSDDESGLPHLAHAATCLMFMIEGNKK